MNILICGVGGQGILLASRVLGSYASEKGYDCKLSEVHGMAQRGGSVITFVKFGENGEKIYSPIIDNGGADVLLAFEKLEALRYAYYVKKGGKIIYSSQEIMPMPVVTGAVKYPDDIESRLTGAIKVDAYELAEKVGNKKAINSVMLGALTKICGFDKNETEEALKANLKEKLHKINLEAFELGYEAV